MDISTVAITVGISLVTGIGGAAGFLFTVGAKWGSFKTKVEGDLTELKNEDKRIEKKVDDIKDELEDDIDAVIDETKEFAKEQGQQWQIMNRTLGTIEGRLQRHR